VALPPQAKGAYVGQKVSDATRKKIYDEGARTIPGREHGGNVDIKVGGCSLAVLIL
jgi:formamidase